MISDDLLGSSSGFQAFDTSQFVQIKQSSIGCCERLVFKLVLKLILKLWVLDEHLQEYIYTVDSTGYIGALIRNVTILTAGTD